MGPRPRPPPLISLSALARRRNQEEVVQTEEGRESDKEKGLEVGEEIRVGVVVRMPFEGIRGEEETGWENGMELGVWEGVVGGDIRRGG